MRFITPLCAVALSFSALPAAATTVSLNYDGLYHGTSSAETVLISSPAGNQHVYADGFNMSGSDPIGSFVAWCIDLFDNISSDSYSNDVPTQAVGDEEDLNKLFTLAGGVALDTAVNAAAFQVAIWEIVYETGAYDVTDGDFKVTSGDTNVISTAEAWLGSLAGVIAAYDLTFYTSEYPVGSSQDLVTGTLAPVPLPAGVILLGTGLGMLAVTRRRHRAV
jgi:hypothetical protein